MELELEFRTFRNFVISFSFGVGLLLSADGAGLVPGESRKPHVSL